MTDVQLAENKSTLIVELVKLLRGVVLFATLFLLIITLGALSPCPKPEPDIRILRYGEELPPELLLELKDTGAQLDGITLESAPD